MGVHRVQSPKCGYMKRNGSTYACFAKVAPVRLHDRTTPVPTEDGRRWSMNSKRQELCRYACERAMDIRHVNSVLCATFLSLLSCYWTSNVYAVNTITISAGLEYAESNARSVSIIFGDSLRGNTHHIDSQGMKPGDKPVQSGEKYWDVAYLIVEKLKNFSKGRNLEGVWHYVYLFACLVIYVVISFEIFIPMFRSVALAVVVPLSFFVFTCLIYLEEYLWALASTPPLAVLVFLVFRKVHRRDEHSSNQRSAD